MTTFSYLFPSHPRSENKFSKIVVLLRYRYRYEHICSLGAINISIQFCFLVVRTNRSDLYIDKSTPFYSHRNEPFADRKRLNHNRTCRIVLVGRYRVPHHDNTNGDYDRIICRHTILRLSQFVGCESGKYYRNLFNNVFLSLLT